VIIFCFGGRRENIALQLPCIRRILELNPEAEYHLWDLARDPADSAYLRTITGERITVITDFAGDNPWERFNDVYRHYAADEYQDCLFVKLDDDVVFLEADRFADFVCYVNAFRDTVWSAKVVNNGACTFTQPGLQVGLNALTVPLLDVHLSPEYADVSHRYFFDHWPDMLRQPLEPLPTSEWLSINVIGYDWAMGKRIADLVGIGTPRRMIAGRRFKIGSPMGDEGAVNTLPRTILNGFLACHLSFGPQAKLLTTEQLDEYRARYAWIGEHYLLAVEAEANR
jgi:hypothetical protein